MKKNHTIKKNFMTEFRTRLHLISWYSLRNSITHSSVDCLCIAEIIHKIIWKRRVLRQNMDPEVVVATRYDTAVRTAVNFLSVFLAKCGVKNSEEVDYRPLFENFVQVRYRQP